MAATHPPYNLMKMPSSNGVLTVAGDTKGALQALKLAFHAKESPIRTRDEVFNLVSS